MPYSHNHANQGKHILYIYICINCLLKKKRCKLIQYLLRIRFSLLIWWFSCLLCVTRCLFSFLRVKFISPTPLPCLVKSWLLSLGLRETTREFYSDFLLLLSSTVLILTTWLFSSHVPCWPTHGTQNHSNKASVLIADFFIEEVEK